MSENAIRLSIPETMKASWEKVSGSKSTIWSVLICIIIVRLIVAGINKLVYASNGEPIVAAGPLLLGSIAILLLTFLAIILQWGLAYIAVQRAMDVPIQFNMLKQVFNFRIILRMIGVTIVGFIIMLPAAIFLFLPSYLNSLTDPNLMQLIKLVSALSNIAGFIFSIWGVYLNFRLLLVAALILVKRVPLWRAIKLSFKATKSNVWRMLGLVIVNVLLLLVSAIPLGIGLIWSLPYSLIAYGMIYKNLFIARTDLAS